MAIAHVRNEDIKLTFVNGFATAELLPKGVFPGVKHYRSELQAGHTVTPEVFGSKEALRIVCLTDGEGYITVGNDRIFVVDELSFFVPRQGEPYTLHASTHMRLTTFVVEMTEDEKKEFNRSHLVLPFFRKLSTASEYWQDCKTEGTRNWSIIGGHQLYPIIMGVVRSSFGGTIEKGHPSVAQWNVILGDSELTFIVEEESVYQRGGDFSYVDGGPDHALINRAGKELYYIWFEHFVKTEDLS